MDGKIAVARVRRASIHDNRARQQERYVHIWFMALLEQRPPHISMIFNAAGGNHKQQRPAGTAVLAQKDCENRASRNPPSFAVALNCGMGSSPLNAEVNASERLQIVRERNSSYFGSK